MASPQAEPVLGDNADTDTGSPANAEPAEPAELAGSGHDDADAPLTMAASVILSNLPRDANAALVGAGDLARAKVTVRLQPVGSAPQLKQRVFRVGSAQPFATIVNFLRKKLSPAAGQGVYCYVNSVFAPGPDEIIGNLWRCFKTSDELIVAYAMMPAFG